MGDEECPFHLRDLTEKAKFRQVKRQRWRRFSHLKYVAMEAFLGDQQIFRMEKLGDGTVLISLMPGTVAPSVGDVVITSSGTWRVEGCQQGKHGMQLRVVANHQH